VANAGVEYNGFPILLRATSANKRRLCKLCGKNLKTGELCMEFISGEFRGVLNFRTAHFKCIYVYSKADATISMSGLKQMNRAKLLEAI